MPPSGKSDILQGMLDMLILNTVAYEPLHGYGIGQRLRLMSRERLQVPQGSLYPALHRLENRGFLRGVWSDTATGREAKFYRLTPKGRRHLATEVTAWHDLAATIAIVLAPA